MVDIDFQAYLQKIVDWAISFCSKITWSYTHSYYWDVAYQKAYETF